MKGFGLSLIGFGILAASVGASTSDMRVELGIPTEVDGLVLGGVGLVLFAVGAVILHKKVWP